MTSNEVLRRLEQTGALLNGHFELRSGLHSDRYFQCANALRYPRVAGDLCAALAARLRAALPDAAVDAVIAPALGGIIVGHELARALDAPCIFAEKQDGRLALRRFRIDAGRSYVVAEDVITRGGRVQETVDIVEAGGGRVAAIAVLVDRSGGAARFRYPTFSLLEMTPVTWQPEACPLCAGGDKPVHPGS
ncbi:MAG: orotate phosphoribosyltransferase [Lentisphaerae bacterium]|nr:orotate phosphoribosyltransferase [Lentisphaerota bacterium]